MRFFLPLIMLLFSCIQAKAQTDSIQPPYKRFPGTPPFQILLGDSLTLYAKADLPKKKALLLMLFSPDCHHCQHEAGELVKYKDQLKNIQVVMITMHPLWMMNEFVEKYQLKQVPDIVVGQDIYYLMPAFFNIRNLPFHALYNRKGQLLHSQEGSMEISWAIEMLGGKHGVGNRD